MKIIYLLFFLFISGITLLSCNYFSNDKSDSKDKSKTAWQSLEDSLEKSVEDNTQIFYLVEVASGYNFDSLKTIALNSSSILNSQFDMMKRLYNPNKGIVLPDSCDDDTYCGDYYPRRPFGNQNFVSIEMYNNFSDDNMDTLRMVVFANIFESKNKADSVVNILKINFTTAKTIKQGLYLGCMH